MAIRLSTALRTRLLPHAAAILLLWPAASVAAAVVSLLEHPLMQGLPATLAAAGEVAAAGDTAVELFAVGLLLLATSLVVFSLAATVAPPAARPRPALLLLEPLLFLAAAFTGVALEHPALLLHPIAQPLRPLSVSGATAVLMATVVGAAALIGRAQAGARGATAVVAAVALVTAGAWRIALPRSGPAIEAVPGTAVVLGLDSLSQVDDVSQLRALTREHEGTWYERAVTPGLLTNAVWPAILMNRLPHETGSFFIFQRTDWSRSPYNLVQVAREHGLRTVSRFSDQFTTYVGSDAGFDVDASGPRGWKQLVTAALKDGSVFLPVVLPRLPPLPGARTPRNQSGTYAFDVRAEISSILAAGAADQPTLVLAHLDYLHQARYPSFSDLDERESALVKAAPVRALPDLSLHWQYPTLPDEPLGLYAWKIQHLQRLVADEVARTRFLDPTKGNRLVLFSDHGNRHGASLSTFGEACYHRVVLATFGMPGADPTEPFSLLDMGTLLGLPDPSRPAPADAVVEYTNVAGLEWPDLMRRSAVHDSGEIALAADIVGGIGSRMRAHRPWVGDVASFPAPVLPTMPEEESPLASAPGR